jgi:hypothetical protein
MAIIQTQLRSKFGRNGVKPAQLPGSKRGSTLHNTSSINNIPPIPSPKASVLDLDGKTPKKYLDNKPK